MARSSKDRWARDTLVLLLTAALWVMGHPGGAEAQAACGTVTDGLPRGLPALALPGAGQSYVDPVFGCTVTRLTNAAAEGVAGANHFYSSVNPFNADSTLVLLQKIPTGVQHVRDLSGNIIRDNLQTFGIAPLSDTFWHRTDPNILYYHPVGGNQLRRYNVATNTMTVLHTFTGYTSVSFGHWESDLSWDGDHLAIVADDRWGLIYTISAGTVTAARDLLSVTGGVEVDVFDVTPANGAVLRWGSLNGGVAYFDAQMNLLGQVTNYAGHSDRARDADGADLEVAINAADVTPLPGCTNGLVKIRLVDRTETCLRPMDWSMAQHVSCNNVGQDWCLVSTYNGVPGAVGYANELFQVKLDGSQTVRLAHSRSTIAAYDHWPRAAVSGDGRYVLFDSDMGGGVVDVYLLQVPVPGDATPPTVAITAPGAGATVAGTVTVVAAAGDDVGVAGVQFKLDGADLGAERTVAPYTMVWSTAAAGNGTHTLTAVARDWTGNTATATPVVVIVSNPVPVPPVISLVSATDITLSGATIRWTTNVASDSQVEYGPTTAYGSATPLDGTLVTGHAQALSGLSTGTVYHYRVTSRDGVGNLATSGDFTFTTLAAADGNTGLVGYWALEEGSGTVAADTSGSGNTGTLVNGPVWTAGRVGGGLALDGVDDSVSVPHAPALNAYPLTVAVWVKTGMTAGLKGIVNKYWPGSLNGWQVFMNGGTLCAWYLRDAANYVWDGTGCTLAVPGYADDRWHHVVFVVDGTGGRLYVDGALKASRGWTGTAGAATTTQGVSLGRYPGTAAPYLAGALDEVRLYDRALSADEVLALFSVAGP